MNLRGKIVYTTSMLVILVEAPVLSHLGIKSFLVIMVAVLFTLVYGALLAYSTHEV